MGCISINIERQSGIYASAYRKDGINASASLFCETGTGNYLLVTLWAECHEQIGQQVVLPQP